MAQKKPQRGAMKEPHYGKTRDKTRIMGKPVKKPPFKVPRTIGKAG